MPCLGSMSSFARIHFRCSAPNRPRSPERPSWPRGSGRTVWPAPQVFRCLLAQPLHPKVPGQGRTAAPAWSNAGPRPATPFPASGAAGRGVARPPIQMAAAAMCITTETVLSAWLRAARGMGVQSQWYQPRESQHSRDGNSPLSLDAKTQERHGCRDQDCQSASPASVDVRQETDKYGPGTFRKQRQVGQRVEGEDADRGCGCCPEHSGNTGKGECLRERFSLRGQGKQRQSKWPDSAGGRDIENKFGDGKPPDDRCAGPVQECCFFAGLGRVGNEQGQ